MKRLATLLTLLAVSPAFAQLTPDKAMEKFTVADGLQIELFAAEPMLINPTSIDVDEKGRVWVCEGVNYRRLPFGRPTLRKEGDRIVVLVDETGEGKATKAVTFYQGTEIIAPLGICVAPYPNPDKKGAISYKVYVCQSPDILLFEDKDGDLKADGPPKKFLTGFRGVDHDHGVHGINIGPDGKFYFTVGDSGVGGLQASDGKGPKWTSNDKDVQKGTVWRCDMDGKNLELIAHNFRNNYECCVNSFGEIWLSDNDDDGNQQTRICHVMPGGNYGYGPRGPGQTHWHEEQPGIVHKVFRAGFGSPTGICFYEGNLLPKKYHGQLFHTDAGPRELRCFHLKPKGAGYEAEKENLVTSTDNWFRLSDVCVAPDGSVILSDWYDPGVGGHGMGDWTRGRIYRITPKGHKGYQVPAIDLNGDGLKWRGSVRAALESPNLAVRAAAFAKLRDLPQLKANATLFFGMLNSLGNDRLFVVASKHLRGSGGAKEIIAVSEELGIQPPEFFVDRLGEVADGYVKKSAAFRAADVRNVLFIAGKYAASGEVDFQEQALNMLASSVMQEEKRGWKSLAVNRECLLQLWHLKSNAKVIELFYDLAKLYDGQDHFYRAALNIACGTDPERRDKILADFEKHFPEWNDKVADLVWELRPKSMLPKMEKMLSDVKLTGMQKARIIDILSASDDASAGKAMLNLLTGDYPAEVKARASANLKLFLPTKWKGLQGSKELNAAIDALLKDEKTQIVGLQLVAAIGDVNRVDQVITLTARDRAVDYANPIQTEAVETLGRLKTPKSVAALTVEARAITVSPSPGPRVAGAIKGLASMISGQPKDEIGNKAMAVLQELVATDSMVGYFQRRELALESLAGTRPGTDWLIALKEQGKMPKDLDAQAGKLLRNSPYQGQRNKALLLFPPPGKLDPKKLPPISVLATRNGNPDKGKQLMAASLKGETQCLKCHTTRGIGGNIGPDLSMIGKKASKENLFESILQPSKAIADQYVQWKIDTANGQSITGLLVEDGPAGVTIRDANGKDTKIARDDIEKRTKSLISIMPEDIVKGFNEDDLIDVVAYLFTLKTASLTPETWHIAGPFDNDAADKGLDAIYEPEKKVDLAASYKGKSGPVKWTTVKQNGTGYVDLQAFYGAKAPQIASYVYQQIESPVDQDATILLGNDDGVKVWVNGDLMITNRDHVAAAPERLKIPIKLKKGNNALLMKIVNGDGPHGFYLSVTSEQELKVAAVK